MSGQKVIVSEEVNQNLQKALLTDIAAIGYWLGKLEAEGKVDHAAPETGFYEALQKVIDLAKEFQQSSRYDEHGLWNGLIGDYYTEIDTFAEKRITEIFGVEFHKLQAQEKLPESIDAVVIVSPLGTRPDPEQLAIIEDYFPSQQDLIDCEVEGSSFLVVATLSEELYTVGYLEQRKEIDQFLEAIGNGDLLVEAGDYSFGQVRVKVIV